MLVSVQYRKLLYSQGESIDRSKVSGLKILDDIS